MLIGCRRDIVVLEHYNKNHSIDFEQKTATLASTHLTGQSFNRFGELEEIINGQLGERVVHPQASRTPPLMHKEVLRHFAQRFRFAKDAAQALDQVSRLEKNVRSKNVMSSRGSRSTT